MKSTPEVICDTPFMAIGYKYISQNILGFIAKEGGISTELDVIYVYRYPDNRSKCSIWTILCTIFIVRYFSDFNEIDNHNRILQYDIALEKYIVTHSGHFRFTTAVELGMGIKYGKLLFCAIISEQSKDKKISARKYNIRTVHDRFNNIFSFDFGSNMFRNFLRQLLSISGNLLPF